MTVLEKTEKLKTYLEILLETFETTKPPEDPKDQEFFANVKQETEIIYTLLDEWHQEILEFMKQKKVQIYPHQLVATVENYEQIIVHSYYRDMRRRKYMEFYHSCNYIFNQVLQDLTQEIE